MKKGVTQRAPIRHVRFSKERSHGGGSQSWSSVGRQGPLAAHGSWTCSRSRWEGRSRVTCPAAGTSPSCPRAPEALCPEAGLQLAPAPGAALGFVGAEGLATLPASLSHSLGHPLAGRPHGEGVPTDSVGSLRAPPVWPCRPAWDRGTKAPSWPPKLTPPDPPVPGKNYLRTPGGFVHISVGDQNQNG